MTTIRPYHVALAALLTGAPALAQTVVEAPPATPTIAAPPAATPPTASAPAQAATPARTDGIGDPDSTTPIAPEALQQAQEANAERAQARQETRTVRPTRTTAAREQARAAPTTTANTAPAPAPAAAPATVAESSTATPSAPVTPPPAATLEPAGPTAETAATPATPDRDSPIWPWLVAAAIVIVGAIGLVALRRRRAAAAYAEPVYDETYADPIAEAPVAQPVMAVPIAAAPVAAPIAPHDNRIVADDITPAYPQREDAPSLASDVEPVVAEVETLVSPSAEEVAALTAGEAPVADRPWLELAMRPLRAGTNVDEAVVEIELIVGNSGQVAAENVRIATFMFAGSADQGEVERLLIERSDDGTAPVTIAPGAGTQLDATLAMPKGPLSEAGDTFVPVIVADARYTMPDGSEGHTSATFRIGVAENGGTKLAPIPLERAAMREDVGAELAGEPAHA